VSHDWQPTGRVYTGQEAGRKVFVCANCGFETHRHDPPSLDEKMYFLPELAYGGNQPAGSYKTCDEIIMIKVMES
jgi:hypothetical protein